MSIANNSGGFLEGIIQGYRNLSHSKGEHLWARAYAVSTVGIELEQVRQYIRDKEKADRTGKNL
jgi:REP element-mobilizing transposase RayT